MLNDKITQAVAEAYKKMKQEELKGDQHKIDANKNGEIDAHDFKLLRGKKNEETEPKNEKEKSLASLGHPKDKVTHKDVLIGRGVLKKEGWDSKKLAVSEADELNELSDTTLKNYRNVAKKDIASAQSRGEYFPKREVGRDVAKDKLQARGQMVTDEREDTPFDGPYTKMPKKQPGQKTPPEYSRARELARQAMQKLIDSKKKKIKEETELLEGKMGQLHADLSDHLDKHIKDYNAGNLGHDSFGDKVVAVHKKIADAHGISHDAAKKFVNDYVDKNIKEEVELNEDLRNWFKPDHPEGGWKRINSKGEAIGPCAREPGEPKPKCMSNEKRASLTKDERAAAVAAKRKHDPNPERRGAPINVSNFGKGKLSESVEYIEEKNAPTNPELWSRAKALAKQKFDVYPSAYANGWASKWYKSKGGNWKTVDEEVELQEGNDDVGEMIKDKLKIIINRAKEMHDGIGPNTDMPEWVKSKITLAQDYVSTACDYSCGSEQLGEEVNEGVARSIAKGVAINVLGKMAAKALTKKSDEKEKDRVDERCWDGYKPVKGKDAYSKGSCKKEEVELTEGRPSQRHPLEGHDYHKKSHDELRGIIKDAGEAKHNARQMGNEKSENKYADQVNDASTVLHWRKQNGTPQWYQNKYGHMKTEEVEIQEDMGEPDIKVRSTYTKAYANHYKHALRLNPKGASKRAQAMAYDTVKAKHGDDAEQSLRGFHNRNQNEEFQLDEELSSRAKLVKELFNKAKEKKLKKDVFEADPEMEIMPSPQYSQQKNK